MRVQVGYHDRMGDEQFYYLDFDEATASFRYSIEYISRTGETSEKSWPLHEATEQRGYHSAISFIKEKLFRSP